MAAERMGKGLTPGEAAGGTDPTCALRMGRIRMNRWGEHFRKDRPGEGPGRGGARNRSMDMLRAQSQNTMRTRPTTYLVSLPGTPPARTAFPDSPARPPRTTTSASCSSRRPWSMC